MYIPVLHGEHYNSKLHIDIRNHAEQLRSPAYSAGRRISAVTVGGKPLSNFNSTDETLSFPPGSVAPTALQAIEVVLS